MSIRAIIIDDEAPARSLIRSYLKDNQKIEVVGEFENGFDGLKGIHDLQPDLIFLDVQMPKLNGFELLELLEEMPAVIFTTAYDQYAVKAFEHNAVDYLLKPFSKTRLEQAIDKCLQKNNQNKGDLKNLSERSFTGEFLDRIVVKTGLKIKIIYVHEIYYFEAQDDYVMIYIEGEKHLKQKTMRFFENNLEPQKFVRVHRKYIVNIDFAEQIELYEKDSYLIKLKTGVKLPVSKSGYNNLRKVLVF